MKVRELLEALRPVDPEVDVHLVMGIGTPRMYAKVDELRHVATDDAGRRRVLLGNYAPEPRGQG